MRMQSWTKRTVPLRGALTLLAAATALMGCAGDRTGGTAELTARVVVPAETFVGDSPVGAHLDGEINGLTPPFAGLPFQGVSSLVHLGGHSWAALQDNGFGGRANSADYPLHVFQLRLDLDAGTVEGIIAVPLVDPGGRLGFELTAPGDDGQLHGSDLDPESLVRLDDDTLWLGEEFGPFLVPLDRRGVVSGPPLEVPVPEPLRDHARGLETYRSPDHPALRHLSDDERAAAANLPGSGGLEGLARTPVGDHLLLAVEKALFDDPVRDRRVLVAFDPQRRAFTGEHWFYRADRADVLLTSIEGWSAKVFLVMERDAEEGADAEIKRVYRVDLTVTDQDGFLVKTLVCDLLDLADPGGLTTAEDGAVGLGPRFQFPFVTPESLAIADAHTLVLVNDNNFPFSSGRRPGVPDDTEFIRLTLPTPLGATTP